MKKSVIILIMLFSLLMGNILKAQNVGIGNTLFTPDASAGLEIKFTDKGLLIPRVALTSTLSSSPITSPAVGLLVYNTATAGTAPNNVTPGFYYWDGSAWVRFATSSSVINGSGAATRVAFWSGTNTLSSNTNLYWDNTNNRLGIGTTTPQAALHVQSSISNGEIARFSAYNYSGQSVTIGTENSAPGVGYIKLWEASGPNVKVNITASSYNPTYFNGSFVGIGTTTPQTRLHVSGSALLDDGFEDGTLSPFTTGGNANWATSTTSPYAGSYCAESGTITASQSTYMELTQSLTSPGQISFAIKVSSESCCDKLSFYIDGTLINSWGGEVAWTIVTYAVSSGSHTFKWEYSKDYSVDSGSDKAWIDNIKIYYNLVTIDGNTEIGGNTIVSGNVGIGGNTNIGGNTVVSGNVGIGTTSPTAKLHVVTSAANQMLAYFYQSYNNYMYIQDTSSMELLYASRNQKTSKGDGQATIYGYRNRDSQNDGTGYGHSSSNGAVKGYNYWGDLYSYGVGGFNWNDYNRSGGVLGAQWAGSYWGSLGYKNSGGTTYGGYWSNSGSGGGYSSIGGAMAGVGAGGYGDMLGLWSRGEVMGAIFSGELFSTYNLGNTYTSGTQVELVNVGSSKIPAYSVTAPEIKVYDNGFAQLNGNETKINFNQNFIYLLDDQKPVVTITPIGKSANLYIKSIDKDGFIVACDTPQDIQFSWIAVGTRIDNKEVQRVPEELTDINFDNNLVDFMFNENIKERSAKAMWWDGSRIQFGKLPEFFYQADREAKQAELEKMKQLEENNNIKIDTEKKSK